MCSEGEVDRLLVLEVLPKPVHHDGHTETISWNGNFFIERVLGTCPSSRMVPLTSKCPRKRCLFFVAVDKQGSRDQADAELRHRAAGGADELRRLP